MITMLLVCIGCSEPEAEYGNESEPPAEACLNGTYLCTVNDLTRGNYRETGIMTVTFDGEGNFSYYYEGIEIFIYDSSDTRRFTRTCFGTYDIYGERLVLHHDANSNNQKELFEERNSTLIDNERFYEGTFRINILEIGGYSFLKQ